MKYGNRKTHIGNDVFDSAAEARRWTDLQLLQKAGRIRGLERQVKYELAPPVVLGGRKKPALRYVADFSYWQGDALIVEDVKGVVTPLFRVKQHLMKSVHGIEVKVYP